MMVTLKKMLIEKMVRSGQNLKAEATGFTNRLEVDYDKKEKK